MALGTVGVASIIVVREVAQNRDDLVGYGAASIAVVAGGIALNHLKNSIKIKNEATNQDEQERKALRAELRKTKPHEVWYQNPDNPRDYELVDGRMSHAALVRVQREQLDRDRDGRSALYSEPMDSGLWPTAGLSDRQTKMLSEALSRVQRSALSRKSQQTQE